MNQRYDIVLVWAGIMSATLATLLHELDPTLTIAIYEQLDQPALESSDARNNAGTWHSAFCELNYTPQSKDGSVKIDKAVVIAEAFEVSKQFWSTLIEKWYGDPDQWIYSIPHCSIVFGEEDVQFLRTRWEKMVQNPLFAQMRYSEDVDQIREWMPLVMQWREVGQKIAATHMELGTDVNFGNLTRSMVSHLTQSGVVSLFTHHEVSDMTKGSDGLWSLRVQNLHTHRWLSVRAKFVFIGAGGGALHLLQNSGITERKGLGGFPVSGQWLVCHNPDIIAQHTVKVYGKAALWAPPMSVPHLDTRIIDGQKSLLFGPFAWFTTKFLKSGSWLDLPLSLAWHNIISMIWAGIHNIPLTRYLIEQVLQSSDDRIAALREYMPSADAKDRELREAWYRVQIIKPDSKQGGVLQFGTEVIVSWDHTLATLLWASPGASTSVDIMLRIVEQCWPQYHDKISTLIPSYGQKLYENSKLLVKVRERSKKLLKLQ
jgi:malate dehydrogenase (quinone)